MTARAALAVLAAAIAFAAAWAAPVDAGHSRVVAQYRQMNVPVEAPFRRFSGMVEFDPAQPAQAIAHIEVDTASLDLGEEDYNSEVRKPEWFDSAHFAKAVFDAKGLKPAGTGHYETDGTLQLKGKSQPLHLSLAVSQQNGAPVFDGALPVSRAYFSIGGAEWNDTLADQVLVKFHIVASAHP